MESVSDKTLGLWRNEESLNTGLQAYDRLEKDLESVEIADKTLVYNRELIRMLQAENTLLCSVWRLEWPE